MSVLTVGGKRFAAGLDWERQVVQGRRAADIARDRGHSWTVDLGGQTGFLGDTEEPGGLPALAGALAALVRGRRDGTRAWTAVVEEDGEGEGRRRVAVVRSSGGSIVPGGDNVYASSTEAQRALGAAGGRDVAVYATPGLVGLLEEAVVIAGFEIAAAAKNLPVLVEAPKRTLSRAAVVAAAVLLAFSAAAYPAWQYYDDILVWAGVRKEEPKPPPMVEAVLVTPAFLSYCRQAWDGFRLHMAGFDRKAVVCHPRFVGSASGVTAGHLLDRAVVEVRWVLREGLDPRVYGPLALDMLSAWPKPALIDDKGTSAAFAPLPRVIELHDPENHVWLSEVQFRDLVDRTLALRSFDIEYTEWGAEAEAVLRTDRPLREAVAMLAAMEGVEVASASWDAENGWRFGVRRVRPFTMLKQAFQAQAGTEDAAADGAAGETG